MAGLHLTCSLAAVLPWQPFMKENTTFHTCPWTSPEGWWSPVEAIGLWRYSCTSFLYLLEICNRELAFVYTFFLTTVAINLTVVGSKNHICCRLYFLQLSEEMTSKSTVWSLAVGNGYCWCLLDKQSRHQNWQILLVALKMWTWWNGQHLSFLEHLH